MSRRSAYLIAVLAAIGFVAGLIYARGAYRGAAASPGSVPQAAAVSSPSDAAATEAGAPVQTQDSAGGEDGAGKQEPEAGVAKEEIADKAEKADKAENDGKQDAPASGDKELPPPPPENGAVDYTDMAVDGVPALAIVVDDCGHNWELAKRLRDKRLPVTWAVIPFLRHTKKTVEMLNEENIPFILHCPMEALGDTPAREGDPSYFLIGTYMDEATLRKKLDDMFAATPGAYGTNNHRGSVATTDYTMMRRVMKYLGEREMFFLDSSTTRDTIAHKTAKEYGVVSARNNYFLDNEANRAKIKARADEAIEMTKKKGSAIVICHLRPETIAYLETVDEEYFTKKGVRLVTLPELMKLRGEHSRKGK